jgi:hypothetical protein
MEPSLQQVVGLIAAVTSTAAFLLGFLFEIGQKAERQALGTIALGLLTSIACGLCFLGVVLAGTWGLLFAIALVTLLARFVGKSLGKKRKPVMFPALWLGFCASCALGYRWGGAIGLLTITLPCQFLFWGALFWISRSLLPLDNNRRWGTAFRCLITFGLGTNYPYHVLDNHELLERVPGNPYGQFFAGPGIVLTGAAQAPIIWEGPTFKKVAKPGLTFTERFETVYQPVDLRPQLRTSEIDAVTRDGIRVEVKVHVVARLDPKGHEPKLGESFPVDAESVYGAVWRRPVEDGQIRPWEELVSIGAEQLVRRLISQRRIDELCEVRSPARDPRSRVRQQLLSELRAMLAAHGIEICEAWFESLRPEDKGVIEQRLEAWKAEWERDILVADGKAQAAELMEMERARIEAQTDLIDGIRQAVERKPGADPDALAHLAALRFIDALEDMSYKPGVREAAPEGMAETIDHLRNSMTPGRRREP